MRLFSYQKSVPRKNKLKPLFLCRINRESSVVSEKFWLDSTGVPILNQGFNLQDVFGLDESRMNLEVKP
jgi:hypothetical protein